MTNWTNVTDFEGMIIQANTYAPFWSMMLLMMWAVLTITFLPFGTTVALVGGSFIAGLIGLFLAYMGVVAWKWVLALFAICIGIIIFETLWQKKE